MNIYSAPLLVAVALALSVSACGQSGSAPPARTVPAVATRLVNVTSEELTIKRTFDGEVVNLYSPDIAAEIAGKVVSVHAEPGQLVRKGALLLRLDAGDAALSAAADQAEQARLAAIAADKAAHLQRLSLLADKELVSRASLNTARQDSVAASEAVKAAAARAGLSTRSAGKAVVVAPFDAEVVERRAAPGAFVRPGDILVSLVRPDASHVRVFVPENEAASLKIGQAAQVSAAGGPPFTSQVTAVNRRANKSSRTVEVSLGAGGQRLRPGSSARVSLTLEQRQTLTVPEAAVITEGVHASVFAIVDGKARKTAVRLGLRHAGKVELLEGVVAGAQVAQDAAFLFDGAPIAGSGQ